MLSEATSQRVRNAVAAGRIESPDALVAFALDRLEAADETLALLRDRAALARRGLSEPTTLDQIKADGRRLAGLDP